MKFFEDYQENDELNMAFLDRIFRNRGLVENLGREPLARILEPIAHQDQ